MVPVKSVSRVDPGNSWSTDNWEVLAPFSLPGSDGFQDHLPKINLLSSLPIYSQKATEGHFCRFQYLHNEMSTKRLG